MCAQLKVIKLEDGFVSRIRKSYHQTDDAAAEFTVIRFADELIIDEEFEVGSFPSDRQLIHLTGADSRGLGPIY